jgi:hypothetical protein
MKIGQVQGTVDSEKRAGVSRIEKTQTDFSRVFQQELDQVPGATIAANARAQVVPSHPIDYLHFGALLEAPSQNTHDVEVSLQSTMEGLETVAQLLNRAGSSAREVDAAITSLSAETEKLELAMKSLSADHPLAQISTEAAILAKVEAVKWRRGDYC